MKTSNDILTGYLGDVLAIENHLLKAMEHQVGDQEVVKHADVHEFLSQTRGVLQAHSAGLAARLSALGGSVSANVKEVVTAATGIASGLLGRMRPQTASKFLRDDYVVLSACAMGYEMLHATALALRDEQTAQMALRHLEEITPLIVRLSDLTPEIVVQEVEAAVGEVATGAVLAARENTRRAWSNETVHHAGV